jgi:hypothetical protein
MNESWKTIVEEQKVESQSARIILKSESRERAGSQK